MKIACTGSMGNIGRRLVNLGVVPLKCDVLSDYEVQKEIHRVNPDVIIHTAARSGIDECEKDYDLALAVNVQGTARVCEHAGNAGVIILSSDQVYDGNWGDHVEDEEELKPVNSYGFSKLGTEGVASVYDKKVVRLARGFAKIPSSLDIHSYLKQVEDGQEVYVPTFMKRNYIHLDYVAEALFWMAENYGKLPKYMNYGGTSCVSFFSLVRSLAGRELVKPRDVEEKGLTPRPHNCELNLDLARSIGAPLFSLQMSIQRYKAETNVR